MIPHQPSSPLKIRQFFWLIFSLMLIIVACSTSYQINREELSSMHKKPMNELQLRPAFEANNLRIDILRNYQYTYHSQETNTVDLMPYHPMGFDLGNGLFYDLNGNLSFRVDHLLDISADSAFVIKQITNPMSKRRTTVYSFHNDSLDVARYYERKGKYRYHIVDYSDTIVFKKKSRRLFTIHSTDSTFSYRGWAGNLQTIYQLSNDSFALNRESTNRLFYIDDGSVFLQNKYQVRFNNHDNSISIVSARKPRLFATLMKNDNSMFVVYPDLKGVKIKFYQTGILVNGPTRNISTAFVNGGTLP